MSVMLWIKVIVLTTDQVAFGKVTFRSFPVFHSRYTNNSGFHVEGSLRGFLYFTLKW